MLRVTIEIIPGGIGEPKHLGTIEIANDGTGTGDVGNYNAKLSKFGRPKAAWRNARVEGFERRRLGAYDLLFRVLRHAVGGRNVPRKKGGQP